MGNADPTSCVAAAPTSSIGAGAAMSEGKNIRALTAAKATKNTSKIKNGVTYSRKKAIFIAVGAYGKETFVKNQLKIC